MKRKSAKRSRPRSRRKSSNKYISLFGIKLTKWIVLSAFVLALPVAFLLNNNSSSSVLSALTVANQTRGPITFQDVNGNALPQVGGVPSTTSPKFKVVLTSTTATGYQIAESQNGFGKTDTVYTNPIILDYTLNDKSIGKHFIWVKFTDVVNNKSDIKTAKINFVVSTGSPSPTSSSTSAVPIGYLDSATCKRFDGWTCDPSNFQTPIRVYFYADGPIGTGKGIGSKTASSPRSDLGPRCGGSTAHAFNVATPVGLKDGKEHTIYAYGIGAKANALLTHQKKITCAPSIPTPTRTPTPIIKPIITQTLWSPTPTPFATALRVFITSSTYDGNLGGLTGADNKCQTAAPYYLPGTYKAWLSDRTGYVASRFTHRNNTNVIYKLVDGTQIANSWSDLTAGSGYLLAPINIDEARVRRNSETAWTNTDLKGNRSSAYKDCDNWSSADSDLKGGNGTDIYTDSKWTNYESSSCALKKHLYCFQQ